MTTEARQTDERVSMWLVGASGKVNQHFHLNMSIIYQAANL